MFVKTVTVEESIQKMAVILGKLENKAIIMLIDEVGLTVILEKFLSKRQLDRYYRSKYNLKVLLNKVD